MKQIYYGPAGIVAVVLVVLGLAFLGNTFSFSGFKLNARNAIPLSDGSGQLVVQDAGQRSVLILPRVLKDGTISYTSCSEPPPDVAMDVTQKISASLEGALKNPTNASLESAASIASDLNSLSQSIFDRSQGIQLLRDTMFRLCEGFQNGVVEPETYSQLIHSLISTANFVIPFEQCMSIAKNKDGLVEPAVLESIVGRCLETAMKINGARFDG